MADLSSATWRRWHDPRLAAAGLIVWALGWRLAVRWSDGQPGFYFPDSWNYVVRPSGGSVPHAFHSPFVYWTWDILIPGAPTEARVVLLQSLLGVVAACVVLGLLWGLVGPGRALVASMVFAAWPSQLLYERTFLTESLAVFFLVVALSGLRFLLGTPARGPSSAAVVALGLGAGLALAVRPASRFMAVVLVGLGALVVVRAAFRAEGSRARRTLRGCGLLVLLAVAIVPGPLVLAQANYEHYGTRSLTPASGTALAAKWATYIPCPAAHDSGDQHLTDRARQALQQICGVPRSDRLFMLWHPGPLRDTMGAGPEFAETQEQLSAAATGVIFGRPVVVLGEVARSLRHQFLDPRRSLRQFDNGWRYFSEPGRIRNFRQRDTWFADAQERDPWASKPPLMSASDATWMIPGWGLLAATAWYPVLLRRRWRGPASQLAGACLGASWIAVFTVAVGGWAVDRYWVPVQPLVLVAVTVLGAATVDQQRSRTLRSDARGDEGRTRDSGVSRDEAQSSDHAPSQRSCGSA